MRAVRGGVGFAKTSANYATSLLPAAEAKARGEVVKVANVDYVARGAGAINAALVHQPVSVN